MHALRTFTARDDTITNCTCFLTFPRSQRLLNFVPSTGRSHDIGTKLYDASHSQSNGNNQGRRVACASRILKDKTN
jgi:hypothetical protein